jgi:undecaprenyl-diphosphatase
MNGNERSEDKGRFFNRAVGICLVLTAVAAAVSLLFFDQAVSQWILNHPTTWHKNTWIYGLRQLGKADVPIWLLLIWSCLTDRWRPTLVTLAAMALVGVSVSPLKAITRRERPHPPVSAQLSPQQNEANTWRKKVSFPSGDTAVVFAAATTLSLSLGRLWAPPLFAAAGVVGIFRVVTSAHYPSDVLAGALIGVLCGMGAMRWTARWRQLDQFRVAGRWRLVAFGVLVFVMPFVGPYIGMDSVPIFFKIYWMLLAALVLLCLFTSRRRAKGSPT